jgi:hypothetical protein
MSRLKLKERDPLRWRYMIAVGGCCCCYFVCWFGRMQVSGDVDTFNDNCEKSRGAAVIFGLLDVMFLLTLS